jgi:hypothetical protein
MGVIKMTFLKTFLFALFLSPVLMNNCTRVEEDIQEVSPKKLYWGDLHNHNAVGYAKGSLERTYDIAQSHLDFFSFTAHSQWPDLPTMPNNAHMKWINGFHVTAKNWEQMKQIANDYYEPGKFVPLIGYEWHSSAVGDVHILFPSDNGDLNFFKDIDAIQTYAKQQNAILIPHHPGYKLGWRGHDWDAVDLEISPVAEIFSEHGNAESDRSPYRYIRHSMGGRHTPSTFHRLWEQGKQIGVVASTDDHLGYPGAYGEGLAAVYADTLTRESILDAIKAKRTYGVSGDRIELSFQLNGHWMGETISTTKSRNISVEVEGKDVIDRVEVLKNNRVIYRDYPIDREPQESDWDEPVLCRVEFGWGPWADLNMARVCDWKFDIDIDNGELLSVTPCFQSGPYDEGRRNNVNSITSTGCEIVSYTSRKQAYEERATNSVILKIKGSPKTMLSVKLAKPTEISVNKSLAELAESNDIAFTGRFTSESMMIHRVVFADNYKTSFKMKDTGQSKKTDWYYVRVVQTNGSLAWSSPIWVEQ